MSVFAATVNRVAAVCPPLTPCLCVPRRPIATYCWLFVMDNPRAEAAGAKCVADRNRRLLAIDSTNPNTLIAALSRDAVTLDLGTYHLCCLAGLHLRANRATIASFADEEIVDLFEQVCDIVEPGADNPRKRATHAIQRLRDQRMLVRVDGAGVARAGEYAMTRLAAAVVESYLNDEVLTRESLTLLTRTLLAHLAEVKAAAARAESLQAWTDGVIGPLNVTIGELIHGIDRRRRGLDASQEQVQAKIAGLIKADWFHAVDEAQSLLDVTTATLHELNEVLLRDTHHFVALLQEVQDLAEAAGMPEAQEACQRVIEHVDGIASWGDARQRTWSAYYQYVHRYLRDVVRLDPDRALSQRVRDQLAAWTGQPFHLHVARSPSLQLLRDVSARVDRPAVTRERAEREHAPVDVAVGSDEIDLEVLVREALGDGATSLAEVTSAVLTAVPVDQHFRSTGRVAALVARLARPSGERERPWVAVADAIEIEQWAVPAQGRRA
jgi:chromosome partition protein MukF